MYLGFCSNAFTRFPLEEAIARVAAAGFERIELLCDRPHHWPESDAASIPTLRDVLRRHGIGVANVNANTATGHYPFPVGENVFGPSLGSADPAEREARLRHLRGAIALARGTGSPCLSVTSGAPSTDLPPERARENFVAALRTLLPEVEDAGLRLGIEAEPGLTVETSAEVASVCDEIAHPALGFNLDVGHAVVVGEDPAATIRAQAGRIWHLHLEDIRDGKHFHRLPGEGDVDFAAIVAALRDTGFEGTASVEVYAHKADPDAAARRAHAVLAPLFAAAK